MWYNTYKTDKEDNHLYPTDSVPGVVEYVYVECEPFTDKIIMDNRCINPKVGARKIGHDNITEYLTPFFFFKADFP